MGERDRVSVDGRTLTVERVEAVARGGARAVLADDARERVKVARAVVDRILASGEVVYGVNTGFGKLAEVRISPDQLSRLQLNLLRSHACGVGEPFPDEVVRAMLLLRAKLSILLQSLTDARLDLARVLELDPDNTPARTLYARLSGQAPPAAPGGAEARQYEDLLRRRRAESVFRLICPWHGRCESG